VTNLLIKFDFFILAKHASNNIYNSKGSKSVHIFSLASDVV